jgi:hypothetical protein
MQAKFAVDDIETPSTPNQWGWSRLPSLSQHLQLDAFPLLLL